MNTLQEVHQNSKARYDAGEFPGAIRKDKKVLALQRDNKTWVLAQILEIRKKPEPNSEEEDSDTEMQLDNENVRMNPEANEEGNQSKKPDESDDNIKYADIPVQYYVNYMEEARRNDRWVEENMVKIDDERVEADHALW